MELWTAITGERLRLAELLAGLSDQQWAIASLCSEWTVRDVAAHLVAPLATPALMLRFALDMVRARGSFEKANQLGTSRMAARPPAELVELLRAHADSRFVAPTMPRTASLAEILVHGQDIRVPLGVDDPGPVEHWTTALDFLVTPAARRGFVGGRLPRLRWTASDASWTASTAGTAAPDSSAATDSAAAVAEVSGPASALALAMMGRAARLDELDGDGAATVAGWLRG
ncbi:MAG: maleylpyruvate isomerase family mycothiol-dependent enzyme [Kineosporiaceae bacterium]|nr:maleylpyruvate isomerase family mycothiol-dependent enzyme [Kineosporiaceae bacterium]